MRFRPEYTLGWTGTPGHKAVIIGGTTYPLPPKEGEGRHMALFSVEQALEILDGRYGTDAALYVMACAQINRLCTTLAGSFHVDLMGRVRLMRVIMPDPTDEPFHAEREADIKDRLDAIPGILAQLMILQRAYAEHRPKATRAAGDRTRMSILRAMGRAGRPCTIRELAQACGTSTTNVHAHLCRLIEEDKVAYRGRRRGYILAHGGIRVLHWEENAQED